LFLEAIEKIDIEMMNDIFHGCGIWRPSLVQRSGRRRGSKPHFSIERRGWKQSRIEMAFACVTFEVQLTFPYSRASSKVVVLEFGPAGAGGRSCVPARS
jgi:hypothetical protein